MKIVEPSVEFVSPSDVDGIISVIEECGRTCYQSGDKIDSESAEKFVEKIIKLGHESVLEHRVITVRIVCDRGVSHELVRHRLASYSQESTRYCNYSKGKFGNEVTFIQPFFLIKDTLPYGSWYHACKISEESYFDMLNAGCTPQQARSVLTNSLKTEIVMTANIREWRTVLRQRCSEAAHPQMREVMLMALEMFHEAIPVLFDDIYAEVHKWNRS